ncbi:interleukin-2 receptor subunit beta isoform X2 [Ctenopharyngodon idella]|uniref:Interleukin-2 receptor subunit beta n=2 Tax=Ctenopharyngodon idella TaxID=7959 RepID=A0A5P8TXM4_CTEID|nr:interleukin-2 receptor subunit beta isoform X2 [Ctenopharyngodon idella]XP_051742351.1 interleukin-2 receptor subunit beta isoform X2 [Ctenopharyngodon idella]QFS19119.1 interleukin 2 receptor subunit beta [Ctenopharyngodon idella]
MKDYWYTPLFIIIILYGTGQSKNTQTEDLSCVSDYLTKVSCVWRSSTNYSGQRCELVGEEHTKRCELVPLSSQSHSTRSCSITYQKHYFFFMNQIWLSVTCNGSVRTKQRFQPARHIKTQPPDKPTVSRDNITWSKGRNFPEDITDYEFQLQFKAADTRWEMARHWNISHGSYVLLDHQSLTAGEEYQARVRVKPVEPKNDGYLRGQWSDWSPAVSWRSEIGKPVKPEDDVSSPVPDDMRVVLIIGFHILLVLAGLSFVIYKAKKSNRLLKSNHQHVPDPSRYFQPLHTVHGGNFRNWLGFQNSVGPFLTPQSCDDISPVEISDIWDLSLMDPDAQMATSVLVHSNQMDSGLENSGTSHASSSGFSNMGYFYSKSHSGSLYLESCPVYFTYHPEEGTSSTASSPRSSYDCLQTPSYQMEQLNSPDSGFDMPGEQNCEEDQDDDDISGEERAAAEGRALVSFIMSLSQGSLGAVRPAESFTPVPIITPWSEPVRAPSRSSISEPAEGAVVRPSSMIEPCGSGYLTLKEMQKYSNKSI